MTLPQLVDAMEVAGVTDLRARKVLPLALLALGRPRDPALRDAIAKLTAWRRAGGCVRTPTATASTSTPRRSASSTRGGPSWSKRSSLRRSASRCMTS